MEPAHHSSFAAPAQSEELMCDFYRFDTQELCCSDLLLSWIAVAGIPFPHLQSCKQPTHGVHATGGRSYLAMHSCR
eukprot:6172556-Pleurochrysis_carterae.AAC.1